MTQQTDPIYLDTVRQDSLEGRVVREWNSGQALVGAVSHLVDRYGFPAADIRRVWHRIEQQYGVESVSFSPEALARREREGGDGYANWKGTAGPGKVLREMIANEMSSNGESTMKQGEREFVIHSASEAEANGAGYWNNKSGWVETPDEATRFSARERLETESLPVTAAGDATWSGFDPHPADRDEYVTRVGHLLASRYGLDLNDIDRQAVLNAHESREPIDEFVRHIGDKFDLTPMDDVGFGPGL